MESSSGSSRRSGEKAYDTIVGNARKYDPKAEILGVQVQQMLAGGQEVIIGAVTDPAFGKLVAFGLGGILVEVLKDITFRLAPATNEEALSMLDGIAAAEILRGVRGAKPVHRAALAGMIEKVSTLVADFPEISEMDLNPVFATDQGRPRPTCASCSISIRARTRSSESGSHRREDDPHHEAQGGGGDRRFGGERQDRQFRDEESDQRRIPGRDLSHSSECRSILGKKAYKSVKDVPADIDVAVFAIPAKFVAKALIEVGEKKIAGAVLIPSGFAETGNVAGQNELVEIGRKYGVRLMGPNIYGFYYTPSNLCATFCTAYDVKGHAALSSQSGGIGMAIIGFSRSAKMGVSAIVGLGNKSDIDEDDLLTYFEQDENTTIIAQHLEDLKDGRSFAEVAKRVSKKKPIVVLKAAAPAWGHGPRARTPALSPATTRSTRMYSSNPESFEREACATCWTSRGAFPFCPPRRATMWSSSPARAVPACCSRMPVWTMACR